MTDVYAKTKKLAAAKLSATMEQINILLNHPCLQINVKKTVGMFFTKTQCNIVSSISISGQNTSVFQLTCLGIIIDSTLTFKAHTEKVCLKVKFSSANLKYIRNTLSINAAKLYMDAMIVTSDIA